MRNRFLQEVEWWIPAVLRQKAIASAGEDRLVFIGAADLATMVCDYILDQLAENPDACWTTCELDQVADEVILEATGFSGEVLAAALIGAVVELGLWQGDSGSDFLCAHGVPADDAQQFAAAVDVVSEKLGARGQALIQRLDALAAQREERKALFAG